MKILVIGGGGREHALCWKLARDRLRPELFCAPGNAGIGGLAALLPIPAEDVDGLVAWAEKNRPDLAVVGPEAPLCAGLVDRLEAAGAAAFGPTAAAARLEGSKVFAKEVMTAAGVPTARSAVFTDGDAARDYIRRAGAPLVVKAEGLAAGKGVVVCRRADEAESAVRDMLERRAFGEAGARLVIEECLEGEEASILALVDGERVVMLATAQDHKRAFDRDEGPNTGGMGAYSPAPVVTGEMLPIIREQVFDRTLRELRRRGIAYRGILYAGLMLTADGPKVLEFNCRFGDPETQAILPRLASDLVPALLACREGRLREEHIRWRDEPAVCVVMASGGYPGRYEKGKRIEGLDAASAWSDVTVFHAGTAEGAGGVVTAGGRVLGVTALGKDLRAAIARAYRAVGGIRFEGAHYRTDIGARALARCDVRTQ